MGQSTPYGRPLVLVVEDDPWQRMIATEIVDEAGYEWIAATNADEAVRMLESRPEIVIVFTGIDMPGTMDGLKLADAIRDRWPPVHVIITSGVVKPDLQSLPQGMAFISKPLDGERVTRQLHRMAPPATKH